MECGRRASGWRSFSGCHPSFAILGERSMAGVFASQDQDICTSALYLLEAPLPPPAHVAPIGVLGAKTTANSLMPVRRIAGRQLLQPRLVRAPAARRAPLSQPIVGWVSPSTAIAPLRLSEPSVDVATMPITDRASVRRPTRTIWRRTAAAPNRAM